MKKSFLMLAMAFVLVVMMTFTVSAATTVVDDGTTDITLGACVIEDLGRDIPEPSRGFTYSLDDTTMTAIITKWANYADKKLGVTFCIPSTITYGGNTYTVTTFNDVIGYTDNGQGTTNSANYILTHIYLPDTIVAIPNSAFENSRALEYVYIGSGVETMGQNAFCFAGTTAGGYYVPVESETTDAETGEVTTTTTYKRIEETGGNMGDIKEFIFKSRKLTTLENQVFHHTEFAVDALIDFDITKITNFKSKCLSLNQYNLYWYNYFTGTGIKFDVLDIRKITSIADDAFYYTECANVFILNADQVKYINGDKLRGGGPGYTNFPVNIIICGGETAETAGTLNAALWTQSGQHWHSTKADLKVNFVFRGYINAYDGTDGMPYQPANNYPTKGEVVDYYFENDEMLAHYLTSVKSTTNASTTLARYVLNVNGYFYVCDGDGTSTAYNLVLNSETSEYELSTHKTGVINPKQMIVVGDDCTASTVCMCCEKVLVAGAPHNMKSVIEYVNGFLSSGEKATKCINDGCTKCEETVVLLPIFVNNGYSANETGGAIVQGFVVNREALSEYVDVNGEVTFGLVATVYSNKEGYDTTDGKLFTSKGVTKHNKVAVCEFTNRAYDIMEMTVVGLENYQDTGIYCCLYYTIGENVYYINEGVEGETTTAKTVKGVIATDALLPSKEENA